MADTPDIGTAIGAVITTLVAAAVAFAVSRPRSGLQRLNEACNDLALLRDKARKQHCRPPASKAEDHPARYRGEHGRSA